jgi:uncharacterized protein YqjF (DUF2071 family)
VIWIQAQTWLDVLFAHWPVPVEHLRPAVPPALPIDTFDGYAWVALAPFEVTGLRMPGTPPLPRISRFAETNVRTYVSVDGRPGVHFLSLDAASAPAVFAARATYRLPYFHARATIARSGDEIAYAIRRLGQDAALRARYGPDGAAFHARPHTLEHFLVERYSLFTVSLGWVLRADIEHPPWPLQTAHAHIEESTIPGADGIELPATPPLLHFAERQDVLVGPLRPVRPAR